MNRKLLAIVLSAVIWSPQVCPAQTPTTSQRLGTFKGDLKLTPRPDGKTMTVRELFSYNDGDGHQLDAQPGFVTDGASIPRALWSIVGSPFSGGNYVKAAVIHDEGCVSHKYTWQVTARMFYTAMLDSGMNNHYALLLYYGVRVGGPRWKFEQTATNDGSTQPQAKAVPLPTPSLSEAKAKAFDRTLTEREKGPIPITAEEIDRLTGSTEIDSTNQSATGNNNTQFQIGAGATVTAGPCAAVGVGNNVNCSNNNPTATVARYRCDGWKTSQGPGPNSAIEFDSDPALTSEWEILVSFGATQQWQDALEECSAQLARTPNWLSPLLVCADANFHLGHVEEAKKQLKEFESKRGDAYREQACPNIEKGVQSELGVGTQP